MEIHHIVPYYFQLKQREDCVKMSLILFCLMLQLVVILLQDVHTLISFFFFCIGAMYSSIQTGDISIFQPVKDERLKREKVGWNQVCREFQQLWAIIEIPVSLLISISMTEKRGRKKGTTNNGFHHLSLLFRCLLHGGNSMPISEQSNNFFNEMGFMD